MTSTSSSNAFSDHGKRALRAAMIGREIVLAVKFAHLLLHGLRRRVSGQVRAAMDGG